MNAGITSWGAFVPRLRLPRQAVVEANGWANGALAARGQGSRAFCNWDEDSVTMAVEAGRACLARAGREGSTDAPQRLVFASTTPPFQDRSSAVIAAQALQLPPNCRTLDQGGSQRAGLAALIDALIHALGTSEASLVLASDTRHGSPGTLQEVAYGDAAAAVQVGTGRVVARLLGSASCSEDFVDHFRAEGQDRELHWEERWVRDEGIGKLVPKTVKAVLEQAGVSGADVKHFIFPTVMARLAEQMAALVGIDKAAVRDDLGLHVGEAGTAHALLVLAATLDIARPGDKIVVAAFGSGCDALLLEVTPAILEALDGQGQGSVAQQVQRGIPERSYQKFLSFKGEVTIDFGLRFEAEVKTALSAQQRRSREMSGFLAGRCTRCGTVQFPRAGVCVNPVCDHLGPQDTLSLLGVPGQIVSFTVDWLSFKGAPPFCFGLVQFDNGARVLMELVDFAPEQLAVGAAVRCVYRRKEVDTGRHYHSYFWKAAPAVEAL